MKWPASRLRSNRTVRGASLTQNALAKSSTLPSGVEDYLHRRSARRHRRGITYLNDRNPTAAANLDAEIARCVDRLSAQEFEGPVSRLRSGALVRSWSVPPFRIYYQRHPAELLIVRVY